MRAIFYLVLAILFAPPSSRFCFAADPTVRYDFRVAYVTVSPLGVPQQVIAINNHFPGPLINATTNNNVVVNVVNDLTEDLLITWDGVQMRRNSWQDGVRGTTCPIPPGWNFTYNFQVKDQIGSFFYFPSLHLQRASGGFGPLIINNRDTIDIPFAKPDGDVIILVGDWYTRNHTSLRIDLDNGKELGMPDGVLINGKGPYRYNSSLVPDGIEHETIAVNPGGLYRFRVHNVGTSTCLNFRIQNHNLLLVETEGFYTNQQNYTNVDISVGQSYSFLVTMDQNASSDYYIVASARFVNESLWERVTGVAILHYSNSKGPAQGPLPEASSDIYSPWAAMNQPRSIRQNTSASGARPNPQGSYHYGSINVTDSYVLMSLPPANIRGKLRATLNGISFVNPSTPFRLADQFNVKGDYKLDFPAFPLSLRKLDTSIINATYKGFLELVFQNNDTKLLSFHVDGYSFFVVGMDFGLWSNDSRNSYNKFDAISRCTVEVYPGGWTAVLMSLDNAGAWHVRAENLDRWYLGSETYMRIVNPEENNITEFVPPVNVLYCGSLQRLQKPQISSGTAFSAGNAKSFISTFVVTLMLVAALVLC